MAGYSAFQDPVAVIKLSGEEPIFNDTAFKELIRNSGMKNKKIYVICITGVYRSGKTFLLNLLQLYIDYYAEHGTDVGWENQGSTRISGWNWAASKAAVTDGIWMWISSRTINGKGFLLMDCQGTGDNRRSSPTLDNFILFAGLHLSNVLILNLRGVQEARDAEKLNICAGYADDRSGECLAQRLIFLIRDWGTTQEPDDLDELIESASSDSAREAAVGVQKVFRNVDTVALHSPGDGVVLKSEEEHVNLRDVSPKFLCEAKNLFQKLVTVDSKDAKYTGEDLIKQFEVLAKRGVDKVDSPQKALEELMIKNKFGPAISYLFEHIGKLVQSGASQTWEEKKEALRDRYHDAKAKFENDPKIKRCRNRNSIRDYSAFLERSYKDALKVMEEQERVENLEKENLAVAARSQEDDSQHRGIVIIQRREPDHTEALAHLFGGLFNLGASLMNAALADQNEN